MAVNIGPKIGLEGEAQYKKQLKEIIQETKTLKAEMKETTSGFDKNTTAMEKAKAKAEILNKQIEVQKERIEQTKDMLKKATEAYGESDTRTLQYKESLAKANTELNKLQNELKDTNPVKAFSDDLQTAADKLDKISSTIGSVGDTLTKKVTVPIMALGGASIASFNEVDKGMDIIVTKTGATGEALQGLQDTAKELAKTMPTSFEEAGTAVGEVNTRFELTGQELQDLSEKFLQFANINETDVNTAIDSVQSSMAAWGVSTENAGAVLDTLTKVSQATGASVDELSAGVGDNVTLFQEMGFTMSDAVFFLGQLDKNGVDSASAMAGLKKALANATKDGKSMDEALAELQNTLVNSESDTDAYAAAMELFGNKAGPQLAAAIKDGRLSLDALGTSLDDNLGTVSTTFENTLDAPDKFRVVLNNLKLTGAEVGGTLLESLTPAIQTVGECVQKVAEWWGGLDESQQKTILTIAGIVAAVGPVLSVVSKLGHGVSSVMTFASGLTSCISAAGGLIPAIVGLGSTILPVIGIIAGVAAVIAGVVLVVKNWGAITEWLGGVWETVSGAISTAATAVADWVSGAWNDVKEWTSEAWNNVKETVSGAWDNVKNAVSGAVESVGTLVSDKWNSIKQWTSEAWNNVKSTISDAWSNVKTTVSDAVNNVGTWVSDKWDSIKSKTQETWDSIKQKVEENGGGIKGIIKTAVDGYQNIWQTGFNAINNLTGGKLGEVVTNVTNKLNDIKQKFTDKFNSIKDFVSGIIEKIKGFFNFKWELPKIKLPHFSISGKFSLAPPSIPHIYVDWYKRAYNNPVMFTQPTVIGTSSGLKGFGDGSGGEIVVGQSMLYAMIRDAAQDGIKSESYTYGDVVVNVYAQPGQDVEELADIVSERIDQQIRRRGAAFA